MKEEGFILHTSQSGSAIKGRSADAADECAGTEAEAEAEAEAEPEEEEEEVEVEKDDLASASAAAAADGNVVSGEARRSEERGQDRSEAVGGDGLLEAPAFFPPLFFGMTIVCGSDES